MTRFAVLAVLCACAPVPALAPVSKPAPPPSRDAVGRAAISRMAGCYLVDYNYHETKALKAQYALDARVYDPNAKRTVMELVLEEDAGNDRVRLQHVLFFMDDAGKPDLESIIRHQAEDWVLEPDWVWEYQGQSRWTRLETKDRKGQWVRRITNLDDGLRYQCLAPWRAAGARAEWECGDNFSPIPGRETRDMKRKDYQALVRKTHLVVFPTSWVERQQNVKTIVSADAGREPLAEEVGRNWYVPVDDAQCAEAARWTQERLPFWKLLEETWAGYFASHQEWRETPPGNGQPRWAKIAEVEQKHFASVATNPEAREAARKEIKAIIEADRAAGLAAAAAATGTAGGAR